MPTKRYATSKDAFDSLSYVFGMRLACRVRETNSFDKATELAINDLAYPWIDEINEFFGGDYSMFESICRSLANSMNLYEKEVNGRTSF